MADIRYFEASYKGITFLVNTVSDTGGNRLAIHQFPQHDKPFVENLGRKARNISIEAYVIGSNWKDQRDKLRKALEGKKGTLVHPIYGSIEVECESYTINEDLINEQLKSSFSITFVETGNTKSVLKKIDTSNTLQKTMGINIAKLGDVFNKLYTITRLPQKMIDELSEKIELMTGISSPYQLLNVVDAVKSLISGGISIPWQIPVTISALTSAYNLNFSEFGTALFSDNILDPFTNSRYKIKQPDREVQTNKYTAKTAYQTLIKYNQQVVEHKDTASTNSFPRLQQIEAGKRLELLLKTFSLAEATIAVSQIEFESLKEAQLIWNEVLGHFETLETLATNIYDDASYNIIVDMKTLFINDIQERAPTLNKLIHIPVNHPTPSLVIAYNKYEDASRDTEIVNRNKIKHPGFIYSTSLELLDE